METGMGIEFLDRINRIFGKENRQELHEEHEV
jgi:hypothetical protein